MTCDRRIPRPVFLVRMVVLAALLFGIVGSASAAGWETLDPTGRPHPRHEAAFVKAGDKFHLLGGRRVQPVDIYDPATQTWSEGAPPPVEIHHFQPVVWDGKIIFAGAMTGGYPRETALPRLLIYDPATDEWSEGAEIPEDRRRGGAGAVVVGDQLYLVAGIINGHWDGNVAWMDRLDLNTGEWTQLPDAPQVRDHFQASVVAGKIYAGGGRKTSGATNEVFQLTISEVDVYDLASGTWSTLAQPLPTPRAGSFSIAWRGLYIVAGGESMAQDAAHSQLEAYDPAAGTWTTLPAFERGRHGAGLVEHDGALYACSGSGGRGGSPELDSLEVWHPEP